MMAILDLNSLLAFTCGLVMVWALFKACGWC